MSSENREYIERVQRERHELVELLEGFDVEVIDSREDLVVGRFDDPAWVRDALQAMGVAEPASLERADRSDSLQITCPEDAETFKQLVHAFETIFAPQAIFLDMDGVLADVSDSYRQAIIQTAAHFGLELTEEDVSRAKSAGDANNDWVLTQRLLEDAGIEVNYQAIKEVYEDRYQGRGEFRGLWRDESLIHSIDRLRELSEQLPLGIVTGRPRRDADRFFEQTNLDEVVEAVVCMEDAPRKPAPDPVELLAEQMGVERGWMLGDTPDDALAARAYAALPLGTIGPGEEAEHMRPALLEAGCARIIEDIDDLEALLSLTAPARCAHS